ncbi:MAG: ELWxxDGT repeat protein [Prevotella sp.]
MEILTPEGVELTTSTDRNLFDKSKNIVVAGSTQSGYKVFFTAKESEHGEELWVSDGTSEGTKMVKDIYPGSFSSNVQYITRFNDKVVFQAVDDDAVGSQLWISDGTEEGTKLLKVTNEIGDGDPKGFVQLDETRFVFAAIDIESALYGDTEQHWLWISDGTEEGTKLLKDCQVKYPGSFTSNDMGHFCRVGRKVFFKADTKDNEYTETLWVTDGTEEGTIMLGDINTRIVDEVTGMTQSAQIDWMTNVNNKWLFFKAVSEDCGSEPWYSDGTVEGTRQIGDFSPGVDGNGIPLGDGVFTACVMGDYVYYRGMDPSISAGIELIRTDGTFEGTSLVMDINQVPNPTGTNGGVPDIFPFCVYQGLVWGKGQFGVNTAYDFCRGLELFYTDGTPEGSKMQSDLNPGVGPNAAWEGTVVSGSMYFRAQNQVPKSSQTWELFRIDSKDEFPVQVVDLAEDIDYVHTLRNFNGDLVFTSVCIPRLFRYHYRKADFDPAQDNPSCEIDFDGMSNVNNTTGISKAVIDADANDFVVARAMGELSVSHPSGVQGYSLCDISGKTIKEVKHEGTEVIVSTNGIGSGVYLVKVKASNSQIFTTKLVMK